MSITKDIFDSFILSRMLTEFSWDTKFGPDDQKTGSDYVQQYYRDIFLDTEFVMEDLDNSSFVKIDILSIYKNFPFKYNGKRIYEIRPEAIGVSPKSLGYVDNQLLKTPDNIIEKILNEGRLVHDCFVHLGTDHILFDCNFEQLTLVMSILESTIEFNPLHNTKDEFNFSTLSLLPNFNTHSFDFSFNLSKGLSQFFDDADAIEQIGSILSPPQYPDKESEDDSVPLTGYEGVFILPQLNRKGDTILQFHVGNTFTKSALLLDRTAIQKMALVFLDYIFEILIRENNVIYKNLEKLRQDMEIYIT